MEPDGQLFWVSMIHHSLGTDHILVSMKPITWARSFAYACKPAFSVLLLPFCTVHLMIYSGYSVSGTGNVFTNTCYLMLGKLWYIGKGSVPHICLRDSSTLLAIQHFPCHKPTVPCSCQGHGGTWKVLWKQCTSGVADFFLDDIHGQCTGSSTWSR